MKAPQIIMICLFVLKFTLSVAKHGEPRPNYSVWGGMLNIAVYSALLWWGGFWG